MYQKDKLLVIVMATAMTVLLMVSISTLIITKEVFAQNNINSNILRNELLNQTVMWINHLSFLPGDASVTTSFNAISSGVGGGLSGLIIQSNAVGGTSPNGGNKVIERALEVPPGKIIKGVRLCYELSSNNSFISQIRLSQVQDPPSFAFVILDDPIDHINNGPICVNSQSTTIDPAKGSVLLSLGVNFGNTFDKIVLRSVGLLLQ